MQNPKLLFVAAGALLLLLLGYNSTYIIAENEQAIITEFGKPKPNAVTEPGLYFAMPWWTIHRFEKRLMRWDGDATSPLNTTEQTFVYVDTTARWRISDPLKFYQAVKTVNNARLRLDDIIDSVVRANVSNNKLIELVRDSNRTPAVPPNLNDVIEAKWENIITGRDKILDDILVNARPDLGEKMGIDLIDVRVKKLTYVESVQDKIFDRMIAERNKISQQYRSEGEGEYAAIVGSMENELKVITSEAYREAREVEGKADAEAIAIYAEAFNRDPEFYSFLRTLESYRNTMGKQTKMITTTKGEYFKYLKESN